MILQNDKPDDYVLATGETHTVREFCDLAFKELDIKLEWTGKDDNERGLDKETGKVLVEVDPRYYRPTEVELLMGDYSKAKRELGWQPKVKFEKLVKIMVKADWEKVKAKG